MQIVLIRVNEVVILGPEGVREERSDSTRGGNRLVGAGLLEHVGAPRRGVRVSLSCLREHPGRGHSDIMRIVVLISAVLVLGSACGAATQADSAAPRSAPATTARVHWAQEQELDNDSWLLSADGVVDLVTGNMGVIVRHPNGHAHVRTFGSTVYYELSGGAWVRTDESGPGGGDLSLLQAIIRPGDPRAYLSGLGAVIERVGHAEVRGAGATHYRSLVDMTKVDGTPRVLAVELWLDDAGRVVRLRYPTNSRGRITYDFFDFGVPVEISEPSPADVRPL